MSYSPQGHKESNISEMTQHAHMIFCIENPRVYTKFRIKKRAQHRSINKCKLVSYVPKAKP